jgi:hypothetical protein
MDIHRRRRVRQGTAPWSIGLETGQDGHIVGLRAQKEAEPPDPVFGGAVHEMHSEDVVENGVVQHPNHVHVRCQQQSLSTEAVWNVDVACAVGVQPQRKQSEPDLVWTRRQPSLPT